MKNNTSSTANSQDQTTLELNHKTNNNIGDNTNLVEDQVKTPKNNKTQIITNGEPMQTAKNQIEQDTLTSFDEIKKKYEKLLIALNESFNSKKPKKSVQGSTKVSDKKLEFLSTLIKKETELNKELEVLNEKINGKNAIVVSKSQEILDKIRIFEIEKELSKIQSEKEKPQNNLTSTYNNMKAKSRLDLNKTKTLDSLSKIAMQKNEVISNFITMVITSTEEWKNELLELYERRQDFRLLTLKLARKIIEDSTLKKIFNKHYPLQTIIVNYVYNTLATIQ